MSSSVHPLAIGPRDLSPQAWFVDSVAGSDNNNGGSVSSPLQTIAAVLKKPLVPGCTVYVKRGSYFREQLDGLPVFARVESYGSGSRPVFDASDVIPSGNWSKTGGRTNVYQVSFTNAFATLPSTYSVWENGARLTRVADVATCDTTPGSFFAPAPSAGSTDVIFINATGSTNPGSNGRTYEISKRERGVGAHTVIGVHAKRCGHNDGCLWAYYAKDCLAEDGTKHNAFNYGVFEDVTAWKGEDLVTPGSSTLFVSFSATASPGMIYRRCTAIMPNSNGGVIGFYAHTSSSSITRVIYEDCRAINTGSGGFGTDASIGTAAYIRCRTRKCSLGFIPASTKAYFLGCTYAEAGVDGVGPGSAIRTQGSATTVTARGCVFVSRGSQGAIVWTSAATDIQRCTFYMEDLSFVPYKQIRVDSGAALTSKSNIFGNGEAYELGLSSSVVTSQDNLWATGTGATVQGTPYADLAAYKAAFAGTETNSVQSSPVFAGSTRYGDVSTTDASPDAALKAGAFYEHFDVDSVMQDLVASVTAGP
jgi:hypothetical protein